MEGTKEGDHVLASGVVARELEGGLHDLGAGVAEEDADLARHRGDPGQLGGSMGVDGQVEVRRAEVEQVGGLLRDDLDHPLVAMAGRVDRDAGREIEEQVAIDVLDLQPVAAHGHDGVGPGQAGRRDRLVEGDVGPRLGARQLGDDVRHRAAGARAAAVDDVGHGSLLVVPVGAAVAA